MGLEADGDAPDALAARPGEWHRRATLRDGTTVLVRQIRHEDRDRLAEGLRRLSPASRYLRFHTPLEAFTESQLDYLTRVDHAEHEALVALDLDRPGIPGIGVARYIRDPDERDVAEAAVTVADEYHGQGAGTLLLGALAARARAHGVRVFRNYVLADNEAMLEVFDQLGAERERETERLWRVDLALPEHEDDLPESATGRAFMAAARDGFRLSSLLPPVWGRRRRQAARPGDGTVSEGPESELAPLRGELDAWLADRERRRPAWPTADDPDGEAGPVDR
jgi:RimJ/RimL family protein N-acetyltransferase